MPTTKKLLLFIVLILGLAACGGSTQSPAAAAVENYLQALVAQDADKLVNYSCLDWESAALIELDSLASVTAQLDGLQCQEAGPQGSDTLVSCTGKMVLNYNGELQEMDLAARQYLARQEGGQWRMCGYVFPNE